MKTLTLKAGKERPVLRRHPWIFSGAVEGLPQAQAGEVVAVSDSKGQVLGYGFLDPKSQLVCRLFAFGPQPPPFTDPAYWQGKIEGALRLRQSFLDPSRTNAYRLLHAEGDFVPGIICDVYAQVAVLQLLVRGTERLSAVLVEALRRLGFEQVYLKNQAGKKDILPAGFLSEQQAQTRLLVQENGLQFWVDIEKGQKTGFFLDQRDNRALLGQYSRGQKVLNAFSYTGGFSVYALAGGATLVHSVDISAEALAVGSENVVLNAGITAPHRSIEADCFDFLRALPESYDLIVLDPPAFAKNAAAVDNAARGYKELNLQAFRQLAPQGLLFTFSCSQHISRELFRQIVFGAAADAGRDVRILHQLTQAPDHPVSLFHPEGEYLKGLVLSVD